MAGNNRSNGRIVDSVRGHPLTFGGIGTAGSWCSAREPPAQPHSSAGGFDIFMDEENQHHQLRPSALGGVPQCSDENRAPEGRLQRGKTFGLAAAVSASFPVFTDEENCVPAARNRGKTFRSRASVRPFHEEFPLQCTDVENRPPPEPRLRVKTFNRDANSCFQIYDENIPPKTYSQAATIGPKTQDENRPSAAPCAKALGVRADDSRQPRAQQRKQKLKQRPLQEQLQSTKRAALQLAVARLPEVITISSDGEQEDKENAPPAELQEALLRPAPLLDAPMASPESLHTSFDSITLGGRRSRLEALFSYEEYADDLYLIMRNTEREHRARPDFMSRQTDITITMRCILVDWLVEVNDEYRLNSETLHLAVNYMDRFLSVMTVVRAKLQLVGTTALFIASKFEEIYPPTVTEFIYITDDTYTASQLKRMEHVMLKMLAFDMSAPTSNWFLNFFIDNGGAGEDTVKYLAQFLVELTLVQYELCNKYASSVQAAAALCLARLSSGHEPWTPHLQRVSGLTRDQLRPCVEQMLVMYQTARDQPQQAVLDKFARDKYLSVSQLEPPAGIVWN